MATPFETAIENLFGANLVRFWKLHETSGTTADDDTGNADGTYSGGFTLNQTALTDDDGATSVDLDGTDGIVDQASTGLFGASSSQPITIFAVIRTPTSQTSRTVVTFERQSSSTRSIGVYVDSNGDLAAAADFGTAQTIETGTTAADDDTVHLVIAVVGSSTDFRFYVDDALDGSNTSSHGSGTSGTDYEFRVGYRARGDGSPFPAGYFDGRVEMAGLANQDVDLADVQALWAAVSSTPLVAGEISLTDRTSTTVDLTATDATGGSSSYTYQWHRSTTSGFTPGPGNAIAGATSLTLADTGLTDDTTYYYVVEYDDGSETANSDEFSITTTNTPLVVITDHDDNTSGTYEIMGPNAVWFTIEGSMLGAGKWCHSKVEWDFGDPSGEYNEHRGFIGSHFYDVEPGENTEYTVTCTITNQEGESASGTRTVRVTPNSRRVVYVDPDDGSASPSDPTDSGDPYDTIANCISGETLTDLEVRLTGGKVHTWASDFGGASDSNCFVRSTNGSKFQVVISGSSRAIIGGGQKMGVRDCQANVTTIGDQARFLDPRSGSGQELWAVDCTSNDPDTTAAISGDSNRDLLLLNVVSNDTDQAYGDLFWTGPGLVCLNTTIAGYIGTERPIRGRGDWATFVDCDVSQNTGATKNCFQRHGGEWTYVYGCTFTCLGTSAGGLNIGHNNSIENGDIVTVIVERCRGIDCGFSASSDDQNTLNVTFRNNIAVNSRMTCSGTETVGYSIDSTYFLHNTTIDSDVTRHFQAIKRWSDLTIRGHLALGYVVNTGPEIISIDEETDTVENQGCAVTNSVWAVVPADEDARVDDGLRISIAAFNALSIASGNVSKDVDYNATTYRPDDTDDSDILFDAPAEMGAVPEDYYGNARSGQWVAGAVDSLPLVVSGDTDVGSITRLVGYDIAGNVAFDISSTNLWS